MSKTEQDSFDLDVEVYHNIFKGINGTRPRHIEFYELTRAEFDVELDALYRENEEYWAGENSITDESDVWFDSPQDNSWGFCFSVS